MSCALSKLLSPCVLSLLVTAYAIPASFAGESTNVDPPTVRLWTNTGTTVYRGQLVELNVDISFPETLLLESKALYLDIPWLGREFGFNWRLPAEQWLCMFSSPRPDALACRINLSEDQADALGVQPGGHMLYIPRLHMESDTVYRLSWQLIIDKPLIGEQIIFAPVSLRLKDRGTLYASGSVSLTVRDPPPPLSLQSSILLPPGQYSVALFPGCESVTIGESLELRLCIRGTGTLENIEPSSLSQGLSAQTSLNLLYLGDTWPSAEERCFRWRWLPESVGAWSIPPIHFLSFDPRKEPPSYVELETRTIHITVTPATQARRPEPIETTLHLPIEQVNDLKPPWSSGTNIPMQAILAWTVPPVIWLILRLWCCYRGRPFYFPYYTSAARNALAALKQELRKDSPDAFHVWTVIQTYLRQRFYLSGSVDSHQLVQILGTCGLDDEQMERFYHLYEIIEQATFTPSGLLAKEHVESLIRIIRILDLQVAQSQTHKTEQRSL
jgi:hypothetical protein